MDRVDQSDGFLRCVFWVGVFVREEPLPEVLRLADVDCFLISIFHEVDAGALGDLLKEGAAESFF